MSNTKSITQKLQSRLADIEIALGGDGAELETLRRGIVPGSDQVIKSINLPEGKEAFEIRFIDGEIFGGKFLGIGASIELSQDQAEIIANAYDINPFD